MDRMVYNRGARPRWRDPLLSVAVGAGGGLLGAWMMVRVQHALGGNDDDRAHQHRRRDASPNDTDGTISDEPATMQAASVASEALTGRPLGERGKEIGGPIVHYGFGAAMGALYGALAEFQPETTAAAGVPYGVAVWLGADEIGVPLAGFATNPADYPLSRHLSALASHVVFGLTVEGVRRALLGRACASPQ